MSNGLVVINDPHIGIVRSGHTSRRSAVAYKDAVFNQALSLANLYRNQRGYDVVCGGDVFDKKYNPERVIEQGTRFLELCDYVIAGNHDVVNNTEGFSSLTLCDAQMRLLKHSPVDFYPTVRTFEGHNLQILGIPHCLSQSDFEENIREWVPRFVKGNSARLMLLLHCNWDMPEAWSGSDTALNLSQDLAVWCKQQGIHTILLGHEHRARYPMQGFVQIPGSVFPTAFDNMDDKFVWTWHVNGDEQGFITEKVWDRSLHYAEITANEIPPEFPEGIQFVKIIGSLPAGGTLPMMQALEKAWDASTGLLAVKIDAVSEKTIFSRDVGSEPVNPLSMQARIESELASKPAELALWKELTGDLS